MKNLSGDEAYYLCHSFGIELNGDEVGDVVAGRNGANGEFAPCPVCGYENPIDRDNELQHVELGVLYLTGDYITTGCSGLNRITAQ